ncbi:LuxR C-terminal-related transcriptional regulator [Methyloferula stellata]|uniref:LuxR C-terminal-related transcriptional regulator n=1 Tax=Methyloferula stellata TaxID=876270 RepID=UPI000364B63B|nr:LuxR C-terminal-related transcriptional regulator [Methyloferula stellata]
MSLNNSRNQMSSPLPLNYAAQNLSRLQTDLVSTVRMWAVDEVGAAMAHQLNEPLTALLFYLHEIQTEEDQSGAEATCNARRVMVERALQETKRLCEIMERIGTGFEPTTDTDIALTRSRESINWWARTGHANKRDDIPSPAAPPSGYQLLTPREREVLALITSGTSNKEGGHLLGISTRTFEVHRAHIMAKLGARNAADLVRVALSES